MRPGSRCWMAVVPLHQLVLPGCISHAARFFACNAVDYRVGSESLPRAGSLRRSRRFAAARAHTAAHAVWPLMIFQLAWASLRRHTTRTLLAILGVAVAAAMLLDMVMMSTGLRESFRELLLSRGFELRLAPKGTLPFDTDATIENVSGIVAKLRTNPEVTAISPVLGGTIHVPIHGRVVTSAVLGVNPSVQGDYGIVSGQDPI